MKLLRKFRNYFCYCGIEKDEYNSVKKGAYISNFDVWRVLHILMTVILGLLFFSSIFSNLLSVNKLFYFLFFMYSAVATCFFFVLRKDSLIAQFLIYLSISLLLLFGAFITQNKPNSPAVAFIVFLLITPLFMIDKPYFMTLVLCLASSIYLVWMYKVKTYEVWQVDLVNVIVFTAVGIFLHIITNSIRIKEFVLTKKINIQKDIDELTGLKNKAALTREINYFLLDEESDKGLLFIIDIDKFKSINDNYGHDTGDIVIKQLGEFLLDKFKGNEVTGRFGGDEFILFIKDNDDIENAKKVASEIVTGVRDYIKIPNIDEKISISIGIALYKGKAKNYSEIFKKADTALYIAKEDSSCRYCVYSDKKWLI